MNLALGRSARSHFLAFGEECGYQARCRLQEFIAGDKCRRRGGLNAFKRSERRDYQEIVWSQGKKGKATSLEFSTWSLSGLPSKHGS